MESGNTSQTDLEARVARLESSNRRLVVAVGLLAGFVVGLILARVVDRIRSGDDSAAAPVVEVEVVRLVDSEGGIPLELAYTL